MVVFLWWCFCGGAFVCFVWRLVCFTRSSALHSAHGFFRHLQQHCCLSGGSIVLGIVVAPLLTSYLRHFSHGLRIPEIRPQPESYKYVLSHRRLPHHIWNDSVGLVLRMLLGNYERMLLGDETPANRTERSIRVIGFSAWFCGTDSTLVSARLGSIACPNLKDDVCPTTAIEAWQFWNVQNMDSHSCNSLVQS